MNTIPIDKIISEGNVRLNVVNSKNPAYKALKNNIAAIGVQTPITYRKSGDNYVVINGHMRVQIAKELKLKDIPAYESNGKVDDTTKQLSTNVFTVGMSYVDLAYAIQELQAKGIVKTKKDLATHFGKSAKIINIAVALSNLHSFILEAFTELNPMQSNNLINCLETISRVTIARQESVMVDLLRIEDEGDFVRENVVREIDDYGWGSQNFESFCEDMVEELTSDERRLQYLKDTVGIDKLRAYEESYGVTHEFTGTLFKEYESEQFTTDQDILNEMFLNETEMGAFLTKNSIEIKDCPRSEYTIHFDWNDKLSKIKARVKKDTDFPISKVTIDGWNGNSWHPQFFVSIPKTAVEDSPTVNDTDVEVAATDAKDPYQLYYNKFNKWLAGFIVDYIDRKVFTRQRDENGNLIVLQWLIYELQASMILDLPYRYEGDQAPTYHPLHDEKIDTDEQMLEQMTRLWFEQKSSNADFATLDVLFDKLGIQSCIDVAKEVFLNDATARDEYFKVLSKSDLVELTGLDSKTSKDTLVENATNIAWSDVPFIDLVGTNKGSGSNSLKAYL